MIKNSLIPYIFIVIFLCNCHHNMTYMNGNGMTPKQLSQTSQGSSKIDVQEVEIYGCSETNRAASMVTVDKNGTWDNAWIYIIYKEWSIWVKCFGKVIVLNGVSSSGKTTLANHLTRLGYSKISYDEILEEHIVSNLVPTFSEIEIDRKIYDKAKGFIFSGINIVIDTVADNSELDIMSYCFNYYPISVLLLYSPLKKNLEKCFLRNYQSLKNNVSDFRNPEWIIKQYLNFYRFSTSETITKCNRAVLEQVNKVALSAVLKEVQRHKQLFNNYFCSTTQEQEEVQVLKKVIHTEAEILVTPKINFDMLIFDDYLIEALHLYIRQIESLK